MYQDPQGLMQDREQVVVFRKDGINHVARLITYVDTKKLNHPSLYHFLPTTLICLSKPSSTYTDKDGR